MHCITQPHGIYKHSWTLDLGDVTLTLERLSVQLLRLYLSHPFENEFSHSLPHQIPQHCIF